MFAAAGIGSLTSLHSFDVAGLPTLVEGGFGRAIESDDGEIPLARRSGEPIAGLALGSFRTKVKVRAPVGILRRLVARTQRWEGLAVRETRGVLCIVERHRPEDGGRDVGRQIEAIVAATRQGSALAIGEADHVVGAFAR